MLNELEIHTRLAELRREAERIRLGYAVQARTPDAPRRPRCFARAITQLRPLLRRLHALTAGGPATEGRDEAPKPMPLNADR